MPTPAIKEAKSRAALDTLGLEPSATINDWAALLVCSRRQVEKMRVADQLPPPDFFVGKMPRWKVATVKAWIDGQRKG